MKQKIALTFLIFSMFTVQSTYAFLFKKDKSKEPEYPPMVQTVDEWLDEATAVKSDLRKPVEDKGEKDEKYIKGEEPPAYLVPYNIRAGSKELDLSQLYKNQLVRSPFIADSKVENIVYTETYYYPQSFQAASTLFLFEADTNSDKKDRIIKADIFEHKRYPLISTALPYYKNGLFSTLTLVDFSSDGKKLLVRQKTGSNKFGTYETYVWVYFITDEKKENNKCYLTNIDFSSENSSVLEDEFSGGRDNNFKKENNPNLTKDDINLTPPNEKLSSSDASTRDLEETDEENLQKKRWYNVRVEDFKIDDFYSSDKENLGFGVRLNLLNDFIKAYWYNKKGLNLNHIRWDIHPLGFNSSNDNEIIVKALAWNNEGKEVSLGFWAVNLEDGMPRYIEGNSASVGANALVIIRNLK